MRARAWRRSLRPAGRAAGNAPLRRPPRGPTGSLSTVSAALALGSRTRCVPEHDRQLRQYGRRRWRRRCPRPRMPWSTDAACREIFFNPRCEAPARDVATILSSTRELSALGAASEGRGIEWRGSPHLTANAQMDSSAPASASPLSAEHS
eukprot:351697-Chlamydomonas_euryale.AAC.6